MTDRFILFLTKKMADNKTHPLEEEKKDEWTQDAALDSINIDSGVLENINKTIDIEESNNQNNTKNHLWIDDISSYIQEKKAKEWTINKQTKLVYSLDWTDLKKINNIYAVVPNKKWEHKLVFLRNQAPWWLIPDEKWREKWTVYEKRWRKVYDVHADFMTHPTLRWKNWEFLGVWIIDNPEELDLQMNAIKEWVWKWTNFLDPLVVNTTNETENTDKKIDNEEKETVPEQNTSKNETSKEWKLQWKENEHDDTWKKTTDKKTNTRKNNQNKKIVTKTEDNNSETEENITSPTESGESSIDDQKQLDKEKIKTKSKDKTTESSENKSDILKIAHENEMQEDEKNELQNEDWEDTNTKQQNEASSDKNENTHELQDDSKQDKQTKNETTDDENETSDNENETSDNDSKNIDESTDAQNNVDTQSILDSNEKEKKSHNQDEIGNLKLDELIIEQPQINDLNENNTPESDWDNETQKEEKTNTTEYDNTNDQRTDVDKGLWEKNEQNDKDTNEIGHNEENLELDQLIVEQPQIDDMVPKTSLETNKNNNPEIQETAHQTEEDNQLQSTLDLDEVIVEQPSTDWWENNERGTENSLDLDSISWFQEDQKQMERIQESLKNNDDSNAYMNHTDITHTPLEDAKDILEKNTKKIIKLSKWIPLGLIIRIFWATWLILILIIILRLAFAWGWNNNTALVPSEENWIMEEILDDESWMSDEWDQPTPWIPWQEENTWPVLTLRELEAKLKAQQLEAQRLLNQAQLLVNNEWIKFSKAAMLKAVHTLNKINTNPNITAWEIQRDAERIDLYIRQADSILR